jgi:hypothetical protein
MDPSPQDPFPGLASAGPGMVPGWRAVGFADCGQEPVAALGNSLNVAGAVFAFAIMQNLAQLVDGLGQVVFFNGGPRPNAIHQFVLFEQTPLILYQNHQDVEDPGRQVEPLRGTQKQPLPGIELERAELV